MSADHGSSSHAGAVLGASSKRSPTFPSSKASIAPPKVTGDERVELKDILPAAPALPVEQDIMQLARMGELGAIQRLIDSGDCTVDFMDEEGITPLHWAAINSQYAVCRYLVEAGADVNAKGGESISTPAMWAAQKGHYYIVNLLLQNGADPLLADVQGYNVLHLATFDGDVFLLILLLHNNISVDIPDPHGHTALMWAAYKGHPACVDLFLRWGANVYATDETGFTALHWALVKGNHGCVQKLIEYGSDRFAKTSTDKTPAVTAEEMRTTHIWHKALSDCGYDEEGKPKSTVIPLGYLIKDKKSFAVKFFFMWPFLMIWCVIMVLSHMVVFAAIPITLAVIYGMQWVAQEMLQWAPNDMKSMHRTPFLAGIFAGTMVLVGVQWFTAILPVTLWSYPISNILFAVCYGLCGYFYFCSVLFDPGYVPKLGGISQQKAVIDELFSLWIFDDQNFCVQCMVRMPLRGKHCKRCGRHFFLYILTLEIGLLVLVRLGLVYFGALPEPTVLECNILSPSLCRILNSDPFTAILSIFTTIQLVWITMLLVVQVIQISRAQTTYENMKSQRIYDQGHKASGAIASALVTGASLPEGLRPPVLDFDAHGHSHHGHSHQEGWFSHMKKLFGLDTFVATAQDGLATRNRSRHDRNPFSRGIMTNCKDFCCDPAPVFSKRATGTAMLGGEVVNYARMYERPSRMKLRSRQGNQSNGTYQSVPADDTV
ncbi:MAG: palmitoyltransferase akr1 [Geoglossum simile]|nr:MAG: palmitoyltransferase akr1 [Geoglossum simile]